MSVIIQKKSQEAKHLESVVSRIDSESQLNKELSQEDLKIVSYIRNGIDNRPGISLSQELCLHRKKIIGVVDENEWNDYVAFVNACIEKARENFNE